MIKEILNPKNNRVIYTLIFIILSLVQTVYCQKDTTKNTIEITHVVDSAAHFVGGQLALMKFIQQNLKYPLSAQMQMNGGKPQKVYVNFVILASGKITDIITNENIRNDLRQEAIRLAKSMPDWVPAYYAGKPVNTRSGFPITFHNMGLVD